MDQDLVDQAVERSETPLICPRMASPHQADNDPPAAGERWRLAACLLLGPGVCERTRVAHVVPGVSDPAVGALGAAHGARRRASLGPFCLWRANASGRPGGRLRSCEANFRAAIAPAVAAVAYRGSFGVTVFGPERYRGVRSPPAN